MTDGDKLRAMAAGLEHSEGRAAARFGLTAPKIADAIAELRRMAERLDILDAYEKRLGRITP